MQVQILNKEHGQKVGLRGKHICMLTARLQWGSAVLAELPPPPETGCTLACSSMG